MGDNIIVVEVFISNSVHDSQSLPLDMHAQLILMSSLSVSRVIGMRQDIPEKFWTDWLKADEEQRIKLIQKTMIARELAEHAALRFAQSKIKKTFIT